jgi:hypothetical protein
MRIQYPPFINTELTLKGAHSEGALVVIDAHLGAKMAKLILSEAEARQLKGLLEQELLKAVLRG